eukprot:5645992-Ditylum_brightwellii.AAC.1
MHSLSLLILKKECYRAGIRLPNQAYKKTSLSSVSEISLSWAQIIESSLASKMSLSWDLMMGFKLGVKDVIELGSDDGIKVDLR